MHEEVTVDDLADHFFYKPFLSDAPFKAETGYSMRLLYQRKRLLAAKTQPKRKERMTEACYACGFRDYSTFSRAFKEKNSGLRRNIPIILYRNVCWLA